MLVSQECYPFLEGHRRARLRDEPPCAREPAVNVAELGYLAFGAALVVLFAAIMRHYYARQRRSRVEDAKYKMLDDD